MAAAGVWREQTGQLPVFLDRMRQTRTPLLFGRESKREQFSAEGAVLWDFSVFHFSPSAL